MWSAPAFSEPSARSHSCPRNCQRVACADMPLGSGEPGPGKAAPGDDPRARKPAVRSSKGRRGAPASIDAGALAAPAKGPGFARRPNQAPADVPKDRVPLMNRLSKIPAKIPATIVTGFLGAGKTTLIRHLLARVKGRRLALLINELGDIAINAEILNGCGDLACGEGNIIELANGCICCTVADDFLPAIEKLLALDPLPHHILIETSGLDLPKPLLEAFVWPYIRARLTVDGVIAVVDGKAVAEGRFADDPEQL